MHMDDWCRLHLYLDYVFHCSELYSFQAHDPNIVVFFQPEICDTLTESDTLTASMYKILRMPLLSPPLLSQVKS